jgi:predicted HTH domain antitoxin
MEITLEIPETVAKTLGYAPETLPRRVLEALLVDECSRGHLTRGKVAELLGLSFQETEDLLRNCRVPYPIKTHDDDALDNASLSKSS